jgi:Ca2+/Na+ antiporter
LAIGNSLAGKCLKKSFYFYRIEFNIKICFQILDLIADVVSARQGFPNMGISACYGGPLFSNSRLFTFFLFNFSLILIKFFLSKDILLGIGIPFTLKCIKLNGKPYIVINRIIQFKIRI